MFSWDMHLAWWLRCHLGCVFPLSECLGSNPSSALDVSFQPMCTWETAGYSLSGWATPTTQEAWNEVKLLALAWPNSDYYQQLGVNQQMGTL